MPLLLRLPFANRASDSGDLYIDFNQNHLTFPVHSWISKLRPGSFIPLQILHMHHILHPAYHAMFFASCCLRIAPWLIVVPFACVLALGRAGRRVRDRGTY